jgi:hypothetical protein
MLLSISAKAVDTGTFLASITEQNMLPHPSPTANLVTMPIRVVALAIGLCVLFYPSPRTLTFPHH